MCVAVLPGHDSFSALTTSAPSVAQLSPQYNTATLAAAPSCTVYTLACACQNTEIRLLHLGRLQVMDKTAAAGWPGIRLSELGDVGDTAAAATTPMRPSPAASAAEDEEMLVSCCVGCCII